MEIQMEVIIPICIFITVVLLFEGLNSLYRSIHTLERSIVKKRLKKLTVEHVTQDVDLVRNRALSSIPFLDRVLSKLSLAKEIDNLLREANVRYHASVFIMFSCLLTFLTLFVGMSLMHSFIPSALLAFFAGLIPYFILKFLKKKRLLEFERQLPDALDLIARSLKAGHSFAAGLKMTAEESRDPISSEFSKTLDEHNFGLSLADALKNLVTRVDCPDLKFFAVSVIIQRDTGGNLAEILENISHIVRERFKLQGHVRTLSAEGKLSAIVLLVLPFLVASAIYFVNPEYMSLLYTDPIGRILLTTGLMAMTVGTLVIRRMVNFKV